MALAEKELSKADEKLLEKTYPRLIHFVIHKYFKDMIDNPFSYDDLFIFGTDGLIKALKRFDSRKGEFTTCAVWNIRGEILYARKRYYRKNPESEVSMDTPVRQNDKNNTVLTVGDLVPIWKGKGDVFKPLEMKLDLEEVLGRLEPRNREIIELLYGLNDKDIHTERQVAEKTGISQPHVSRIKKKSIKEMRKWLGKDYLL